MIEKPARYLDNILLILSEDFDKFYSVQEIQNKLTPMSIFGEVGDVNFSQDLLIDLRNGLAYLLSLNLVQNKLFEDEFKLTFEGYFKIKTKGFSKELKEKSTNQILQRLAWVLPIVISLLALMISIFKAYPTKYLDKETSCPKEVVKASR